MDLRRSYPFVVLALVACIVTTAASAQAPPKIGIRAWDHGPYGRIVFDWPEAVAYRARIEGATLVVDFDRRLVPSFARVFRNLPNYVSQVGLAGGGQTVRFQLTEPFDLRSFVLDDAVVIDLMRRPPDQAGIAGIVGEPGLAALPLRFGGHPGFSRVVFDWPRNVGYGLSQRGNRVAIGFDQPARVDLRRIASALPRFMSDMRANLADGRLSVSFDIPDGSQLRNFRVGTRVVVDVLAPSDLPPERPIEAVEAPAEPPPAVAESTPPPADPDALAALAVEAASELAAIGESAPAEGADPPPAPTVPDALAALAVEAAAEPVAVGEATPAEGVESPPAPDAPEALAAPVEEAAAELAAIGEAEPVDSADPAPALRAPTAPAREVPVAETVTPAATATSPAVPATEQSAPLVEIDDSALSPPGMVAGVLTLDLESDHAAKTAHLRFDWDAPVAAAVFVRAGQLWAVFDAPADIDFGRLALDPSVVAGGVQIPIDGRTVTVFRLVADVKPIVSRDDLSWVIDLEAKGGTQTALPVLVENDSEVGARIVLPGENFGGEIILTDPEVGDQLIIVPVLDAGHGVTPSRLFVDFELLETAQGIAVRPITDAIAVRSLRDGVEVTSLAGLQLATAAERSGLMVAEDTVEPSDTLAETMALDRAKLDPAAPDGAGGPLFDFRAWRRLPGKSYLDSLQAHNINLALSTEDMRPEARRNLARFNFANGFMPEALGWIDQAVTQAPWLDRVAEIRGMRAAANMLLERPEDARPDLFDEVFDTNRDLAVWRGAYLVQVGRAAEADPEFIRGGRAIERYPLRLRSQLRLQAVEAALAAQRTDRAESLIDQIIAEEPKSEIVELATFYRGIVLAALNQPIDAIDVLKGPAESNHRRTRMRAARARIELMLNEGMLSVPEAIDDLENLRFAWRGDQLELKLLKRLSELYAENHDYGESLSVSREAISIFPNSILSREIAESMNQTYQDLFLGGLADTLPPISALAIYYDFRELTPPGNLGDQLIYRLADRMVAVDLLKEAASLLQHQIEFRLRGPDLSRVGVRLAEIYLLDNKPDRAIAALRASDTVDMNEELKQARKYLMGHAMAKAGQYDRVLELMAGDQSRDANLLRAEVYWSTQDWIAAATVLQRLLGDRMTDEPLTGEESTQITRLAVALALANNRRALGDLRTRYGELMAQTTNGDAFRAIASYVDGGTLDPSNLAGAVAEIDTYEAFMAGLRERVEGDSLSAIN